MTEERGEARAVERDRRYAYHQRVHAFAVHGLAPGHRHGTERASVVAA